MTNDVARVVVKAAVSQRWPGYQAVFSGDVDDFPPLYDSEGGEPVANAFYVRPVGRWPWADDPDAIAPVGQVDATEADELLAQVEGVIDALGPQMVKCHGAPLGEFDRLVASLLLLDVASGHLKARVDLAVEGMSVPASRP